jgi:hypothetical protein
MTIFEFIIKLKSLVLRKLFVHERTSHLCNIKNLTPYRVVVDSLRAWYFTCKKLENIICDGILHVNVFHYFKIPYFTCNFFTKFTYNEYIGPYFLSDVVLRFSPNDLPEFHMHEYCQRIKHAPSNIHSCIMHLVC